MITKIKLERRTIDTKATLSNRNHLKIVYTIYIVRFNRINIFLKFNYYKISINRAGGIESDSP